MTRHLARLVVVAAGSATAIGLAAPATAGADPQVVADGLRNPRGLAVDPNGALVVAEAGRGGSGPCVPGPEGRPVCFGTSGRVTRIDPDDGGTRRLASGLPSLAEQGGARAVGPSGRARPSRAEQDGSRAIGPSDVSYAPDGRGYLTVGLGADPALREQLPPAGRGMAFLDRLRRGGGVRALVDLG